MTLRPIEKLIANSIKSDDMFRGLLEAAPDAMAVVNRCGEPILLNTQLEKLFGYEREELLRRTIDLSVPNRFRAKTLVLV